MRMWIKIQFPKKKEGKNKKSEKIEQEWKIRKKYKVKIGKIRSKEFARSKNTCEVHNVNKQLNKSWIFTAAVSISVLTKHIVFENDVDVQMNPNMFL